MLTNLIFSSVRDQLKDGRVDKFIQETFKVVVSGFTPGKHKITVILQSLL